MTIIKLFPFLGGLIAFHRNLLNRTYEVSKRWCIYQVIEFWEIHVFERYLGIDDEKNGNQIELWIWCEFWWYSVDLMLMGNIHESGWFGFCCLIIKIKDSLMKFPFERVRWMKEGLQIALVIVTFSLQDNEFESCWTRNFLLSQVWFHHLFLFYFCL